MPWGLQLCPDHDKPLLLEIRTTAVAFTNNMYSYIMSVKQLGYIICDSLAVVRVFVNVEFCACSAEHAQCNSRQNE